MSLLETLGVASLIFVVLMTRWAYKSVGREVGAQSRRESIIEAWTGIVIGFSVNFVANWLLLPLVHASFTAAENWWLGCIYTSISIVRQFAIRRWFNRGIQHFASRLAERFA